MTSNDNHASRVIYLSDNKKSSSLSGSEHALPEMGLVERGASPKVVSSRFVPRAFNKVLRYYCPLDMASLCMGFVMAWGLAHAINAVFFARQLSIVGFDNTRIVQFLALSAVVIGWFHYQGHYQLRMTFWCEIRRIVSALGFALLVDGFLQFVSKQDASRLWLILGWVFAAGLMILSRNALRSWLRSRQRFQVQTLLVGGGETAAGTRAALRSEPGLGYVIAAQMRDLPLAFLQEGKSWQSLCLAYGVEYIIIALDGKALEQAAPCLAQLTRECVPFSISPPLRHLPVMSMVPQYFFNHDVLLLTHSNRLEQPIPRFIKRMFDIVVSSVLLLLASPFIMTVALLIKQDGGPAFFGHSRIGQYGACFSCLKFRSMVTDSDAVLKRYLEENPFYKNEWETTRKLLNDPRITPIGRFLRKSSLDELPQLMNVLKGDMSLVGPRPIVAEEVENYEDDIAHYYNVRPGITGLWQVSGRNDVSYAQRVHLDSWYVRNWSLWHDIAILFKTIPAVLKSRGAY